MINFELGTWQYSCRRGLSICTLAPPLSMTVLPIFEGLHPSLWLSQISTLVSICEMISISDHRWSSNTICIGKSQLRLKHFFGALLLSKADRQCRADAFQRPGWIPTSYSWWWPTFSTGLSKSLCHLLIICSRSWNENLNQVLRSNPVYLSGKPGWILDTQWVRSSWKGFRKP